MSRTISTCVFDKDNHDGETIEERIERLEQVVKYLAWVKDVPLPTKEDFITLAENFHKRFDS